MLGGGAAPPLLAGRWPAERLRALRLSVAFESSLGGGAPAAPHPPRLLGLRPRAPLERFALSVIGRGPPLLINIHIDVSEKGKFLKFQAFQQKSKISFKLWGFFGPAGKN